jgi:protein phosphatase 2C
MSSSSKEGELPPLTSTWTWNECPEFYLSYGIAALKGRCPALTDRVTAVPSFTRMSPPMGLDYFGVFDGFFGAGSA